MHLTLPALGPPVLVHTLEQGFGMMARGRNVAGEQRLASKPASMLPNIESLDLNGDPVVRAPSWTLCRCETL